LALSREGRYLAVGETGYAPRVLIFSLQDASSDTPLVSISEHAFGVKAVAWSPDSRFLASLGAANDGFLFLWKIDPRTGAARLFQQNRCTSYVKGMIWMGNNLITLGVRHIKVWRFDEGPAPSPTKSKFAGDGSFPPPQQAQKPLHGRNILLGTMLDETFSCALVVDDSKAIICSETGDICLLDDTNKQMKLTKLLDLGFHIGCISSRNDTVYIGGKDGQLAVLGLRNLLEGSTEHAIHESSRPGGLIALGFLSEHLVTVDAEWSIDVWNADHIPVSSSEDPKHIPIPGPSDSTAGIQNLSEGNILGASFFTWSSSGKVNIWDLEGIIMSSFLVPIECIDSGSECDPVNELMVVRATKDGKLFIAGDKLGVLRIIDVSTKEILLETKAHSSDCQDITVFEGESKILVASCGRDRTAQLFQRTTAGEFEHFQTLEFTAKVIRVLIPSHDKILTCSLDRAIQIHDLVTKEGKPDAIAAIQSKYISLRASPSSMVVTSDGKYIFVSLLDRSVCQFEFNGGRLVNSFKCNDESGLETVVLESLAYDQFATGDLSCLIGISNTDKSIRVYDAQNGSFMAREWGHTEAINGVTIIEGGEEAGRKVVSVGEDGTIMIWALDLTASAGGSTNRDPSPEKVSPQASNRPPLRRVLSKAELAEFRRPTSSGGRHSSPKPIHRRRSGKFHQANSALRTPVVEKHLSPEHAIERGTPSRRSSTGSGSRSGTPPPESPQTKSRSRFRRPSVSSATATPTMSARKKASQANMRGNGGGYGFGSLNMATEQTCRQLRTYRKKLQSSETMNPDILAELDVELRLTAAALGERAIRSRSNRALEQLDRGDDGSIRHCHDGSKAVSEAMLSSLLDQYSERLVSMLDAKLHLRLSEEDKDSLLMDRDRNRSGGTRDRDASTERPRTAGEGSSMASEEACISTSSASVDCEGDGGGGGGSCDETETVVSVVSG